MFLFVVAAMVIAVLAVVFALQNTATVTVSFLFWTLPGSQALVLLAAVFAGIAVCFLAFLPSWVRHRWTIRQLKRRVTTLEMSLADQEGATHTAKQKLWDQSQAAAKDAPTEVSAAKDAPAGLPSSKPLPPSTP